MNVSRNSGASYGASEYGTFTMKGSRLANWWPGIVDSAVRTDGLTLNAGVLYHPAQSISKSCRVQNDIYIANQSAFTINNWYLTTPDSRMGLGPQGSNGCYVSIWANRFNAGDVATIILNATTSSGVTYQSIIVVRFYF